MAFGIKRNELKKWQQHVLAGEIAFITHYWLDDRFPDCTSVTKVGCADLEKLIRWGKQYQLQPEWIHLDPQYPHFDLFAPRQAEILLAEGIEDQVNRFNLF
ncbi:hypothetical protein KQI76_03310 [Amphibacillus sp. MSJ-3]|uniref:hypothetical protein n=1 Tax=Amphibacillus sp. MSJ-3 TaxID=2841505 RepID=UPI001C0E96CE|nr:hypothetical protein [Amphibacillus sp. MSJ-3]MBU5594182.1 hypothetical protein [Amphibacillus sp. MSJ-3]